MQAGDTIGFTNEGLVGPIPYIYTPGRIRLLKQEIDDGPTTLSVYRFRDDPLPRQHSFGLDVGESTYPSLKISLTNKLK